jgi:hypothetical protein
MTQTEDQMAEATIGASANLATATAADRGVVAALTQANSRLVKQLEDTSSELRELKAMVHQERRNRRTMESSHTADLDIPELNAAASKALFSLEWNITLYFQLDSCATKAT